MKKNKNNFNFVIYQAVNDLSNFSGGPTKTVSSLSKNLINSGIDLNIVTQNGYIELPNFKNQNYDYKNLFSSNFSSRPLLRTDIVAFALENFRNSSLKVIHDNGIWLPFNNTISYISRKLNIPLVISPHGMLEPWSLNYKSFKKKLAWKIYQYKAIKSAKVLHATSLQEAKNLKELNIDLPIAIIPNGIDIPNHNDKKKIHNLSDLGICDDGRKIILSLGRIHPKKGLINLLEAWKESKFLFKEWRLIIAGFPEINYLKLLEDFVLKENISSSVDIIGPQIGKDLENIYSNSKIFILPTFSENFGLVVAEALSYGLPVITTQGAPWAALKDENAGWWCKPNKQDLINTLHKVSQLNNSEYNLMSKNAMELSKKYSWKCLSSSYIKLYQWTLGLCEKPEFII